MNVGIVHPNKWTPNTTVASAHLSKFITDMTHGVLIDSKELCQKIKFDILFSVNGRYLFCDFRDELFWLIRNAKKCIWVQNDYNCDIPSQIADLRGKLEVWTTIPDLGTYINWNKLTFYSHLANAKVSNRLEGLFYWGSFRKKRIKSFEKYFTSKDYTSYISSSIVGRKGFAGLRGLNAKLYLPFENPASLCSFKTTIYLEDEKSHKQFHSLGNRFYEALSARLAILIDENAVGTFKKAGLKIEDDWVVSSSKDVASILSESSEIAKEQFARWGKDYRKELETDFRKLWRKYE